MGQLYTRITPPSRFSIFDFKKLGQYKELLMAFALKDFKILYVQTYLGYAWAVVNPLLSVLVLAFVFGTVGHVHTDNIPYILFTLAGMIGWNFIANVANEISCSMFAARVVANSFSILLTNECFEGTYLCRKSKDRPPQYKTHLQHKITTLNV